MLRLPVLVASAPAGRARPRTAIVTVGVTLALALGLGLAPVPAGADAFGIAPAFLITTDSAGTAKALEAFDAVTISVFDLDGDGVMEIIAHNDNNELYVFNGATGALVAELKTNHPTNWNARELAGPSVGNVTGEGVIDIVVTNSAGWLTVFAVQPTGDGLTFEKRWERFMDPHQEDPAYSETYWWVNWEGFPGLDGAAYLADANGSGRDEIFLQLDDMPGMYALTGDGEVYGWEHWSDGNANPVATDLTGDGKIEVVYVSDGGLLVIFNAATFNVRCVFDVRDHGVMPASISVQPTPVDVTGDGKKELVFGARHAVEDPEDPEWYLKQHAHFFAVRHDCAKIWQQSWDWGNPHVHMHPVPIDLDGDGELDIIFQDWNTIGHKPGAWQVTGPANLFAVKGATGELLWQVETTTFWSNKNIAVADVTGDGALDILLNAEQGGSDGIAIYNLAGQVQGFVPAPVGWVVSRGPSVVDLDGDGRLEILLPIHRGSDHCTRQLDVGCRAGAIQVYTTLGETPAHWPNVKTHNHRFDDLGMPAQATPIPIPEPEPPAPLNETTPPRQGGSGAPAPPPPPPPGPTPPAFTFGDGFPAPGGLHDPMAKLVVHVTAETEVVEFEMVLSGAPLAVVFDGQTAIHEPVDPLPEGNHILRVRAVDSSGLENGVDRPLTILAYEAPVEAAAPPPDTVVRADQADHAEESEGEDSPQAIPVGPVATVAAILAAILSIAWRWRVEPGRGFETIRGRRRQEK